jgi:hypothetical protein
VRAPRRKRERTRGTSPARGNVPGFEHNALSSSTRAKNDQRRPSAKSRPASASNVSHAGRSPRVQTTSQQHRNPANAKALIVARGHRSNTAPSLAKIRVQAPRPRPRFPSRHILRDLPAHTPFPTPLTLSTPPRRIQKRDRRKKSEKRRHKSPVTTENEESQRRIDENDKKHRKKTDSPLNLPYLSNPRMWCHISNLITRRAAGGKCTASEKKALALRIMKEEEKARAKYTLRSSHGTPG